jgi:cell division protein FtsN
MNAQSETFEEEYQEYDEFEDEDEDRGLSGLVVLLMGVVMLGAFASIVWIAYQQGIKTGVTNREVPTVVADPEPVKIENQVADAAAGADRPVYDRFDGASDDQVEVLAEGPEEPVARESDDPIADIASENQLNDDEVVDDAVADRIERLAAADAALAQEAPAEAAPKPATQPTPVKAEPPAVAAQPSTVRAATGTHLVQVGAFRSDDEANAMWTRMEGKLGEYLSGKAPDVERADLGAKGVYYRLRIGPFASADDAKTYCEGLKSRGQDCLVKAK